MLETKLVIQKEIDNYKNSEIVKKLQYLYHTKSTLEIFGKSRNELAHSNFLAWLFNDKENHKLSQFPLFKLLEILVNSCNELQYEKHKFLFDNIKTLKVYDMRVFAEKQIRQGRIDIIIDGVVDILDESRPFKIIIENKVKSKEHDFQTLKYENHYTTKKTKKTIIIFVYLTPASNVEMENVICSSSEFIKINYQSIVDNILEPALERNMTDTIRITITEYIKSLSIRAMNKNKIDYKEELIMAIGREEKKLLEEFWSENQKLITAAMHARSLDENLESEEQNLYSKLININTNRDYSTINIYYKGELYKSNFKKSDIGLYTIQLLNHKMLINDEVFYFLRNDNSCNFQLVKSLREIKNEKKYRTNNSPELIYNNTGFYVARNWGKVNGIDNTIQFIKLIESKFKDISYTRNK